MIKECLRHPKRSTNHNLVPQKSQIPQVVGMESILALLYAQDVGPGRQYEVNLIGYLEWVLGTQGEVGPARYRVWRVLVHQVSNRTGQVLECMVWSGWVLDYDWESLAHDLNGWWGAHHCIAIATTRNTW